MLSSVLLLATLALPVRAELKEADAPGSAAHGMQTSAATARRIKRIKHAPGFRMPRKPRKHLKAKPAEPTAFAQPIAETVEPVEPATAFLKPICETIDEPEPVEEPQATVQPIAGAASEETTAEGELTAAIRDRLESVLNPQVRLPVWQ